MRSDQVGPGLRRAATSRFRRKDGAPLRVLLADENERLRDVLGALVGDRYAPALRIDASDVPSALEALLVRHPDLVICELKLSGHPQGGFRVVLDAIALGVPAVLLCGAITRTLGARLDELGVGRVHKGSPASALFDAVDRALALTRADVPGAARTGAVRAQSA